MKCIHCQKDTKYKERSSNGGRCAICHRPFAFEPKTNPTRMTDGRFQQALEAVSGNGTVFFTAHQLWYELDRRSAGSSARAVLKVILPVSGFLLFAALMVSIVTGQWILAFLVFLALGLVMATTVLVAFVVFFLNVTGSKIRLRPPKWLVGARSVLPDLYRGLLPRWIQTHGKVDKLVGPSDGDWHGWTKPGASQSRSLQKTVSDDELSQYSFDRAVVTDTTETAMLLVANNFHFENNCAVLSVDGYPQGRQATILTMLRKNPKLQVFAIHDGSEQGCRLPSQLRDPAWFPDPAILIHDLGIRPRQAMKLKMPHLVGRPTRSLGDLRPTLSRSELDWLRRGNVAELAAFPPGRLLRSAFAGFAFPAAIAAAHAGHHNSGDGADWSAAFDFDWSSDGDSDSNGDSFG